MGAETPSHRSPLDRNDRNPSDEEVISMSNHEHASRRRARTPLLAWAISALALALVFNAVAAPAAHAGGPSGGVNGDRR